MRMSAEFEECEANGIPFYLAPSQPPPLVVGTRTSRGRNKPGEGNLQTQTISRGGSCLRCLLIQQQLFSLFFARNKLPVIGNTFTLQTCISSSSLSFLGIISAAGSYLCGEKKLSLSILLSSVWNFVSESVLQQISFLFAGYYLISVISFKITFFFKLT